MLQSLCMLAQTIDARYWERKSKITRQVKPVSFSSTSSTSKSASLTTSTSSGPNSASSTSHAKKLTPLSSTSATPTTPTHLGKDGKLTEEEHQQHFKEKLCMFCGQPGHMAKDCPKSSSKASKARASMVAPATSALAPSESEN